jgi:hypothetical protein
VSPNPTDQPPKGTITAPTGDVTITAGQAVNFAGTASDPDGYVQKYSLFFPEGTPESSSVPSPGAIVFPKAGTYVVLKPTSEQAASKYLDADPGRATHGALDLATGVPLYYHLARIV